MNNTAADGLHVALAPTRPQPTATHRDRALRLAPGLCAAVLLSAHALAQSPVTQSPNSQSPIAPSPIAPSPVIERAAQAVSSNAARWSTVFHDVDADGALWVRARDFKATADAGGFAFIPRLGPDAPQNYPVHFRLARAFRGELDLALKDAADVHRAGDRIVLDRGPVEVRYDVSTESVEQSFRLDVPSGAGPLVLSLDVTTELNATEDGAGFRFGNELGGVSYGAAIALDANGDRVQVPALWTGAGIELTVPADFLDRAVGPIVVDPILDSFAIDSFGDFLYDPDVAYDGEHDRYYVVYEELFSAADSDVFTMFVDGTTGATTPGGYADTTSLSWRNPKVAILRGPRRSMVIASALNPVGNGLDIVTRLRNTDDLVQDPAFTLKGATPGYSCAQADVGGESVTSTPSYFCVVYSRQYVFERDVVAITVDRFGNYVGPERELASLVSRDEHSPTVSKSTGDAGAATQYCVAWVVEDVLSGESRLDGCLLSFDGVNVQGPFQLTPFDSQSEYSMPAVSTLSSLRHPVTDNQYWCVVSKNSGLLGAGGKYVTLCSGTTVHSTDVLGSLENSAASGIGGRPQIATTARSFQVAELVGDRLDVTILQPIADSFGVTERRLTLPTSLDQRLTLATASRFSGGSVAQDALYAWVESNAAVNDFDIVGARVESQLGLFAAGYQFCGDASSPGTRSFIQAFGDRFTTSPQTLVATNMPSGTFGLFIASMAPEGSHVFIGDGRLCLGGAIGRFGIFAANSSGRASLTIDPAALPQPTGTVSARAETWYFQAWYRDTNAAGPTSNLTSGVAIPFR